MNYASLMDFLYRECGVLSDWTCSACNAPAILHIECCFPYLRCRSTDCGRLIFFEEDIAKDIVRLQPVKRVSKDEESTREVYYHVMARAVSVADGVSYMPLPEWKTNHADRWMRMMRGLERKRLATMEADAVLSKMLRTKIVQEHLYAPNTMLAKDYWRVYRAYLQRKEERQKSEKAGRNDQPE